jgi:UDP-3-O-[3-hydroxymyristoyl] N-acetylglucosamine deacetylase
VSVAAPMNEKTIQTPVGCSGVALHSGVDVALRLLPAKIGSGIVLRRTDIANGGSIIPVSWKNVVSSQLATTIGNDHGVTVSTIEHLMAALAGCEIDNVVIEVDGPELPIMDGSAAPFVNLIEKSGVVEQDAPRRAIKILSPITVEDNEKSLSLIPADGFSISFEIDFNKSSLARQHLAIVPVNGTFKSDIAKARTFGFAEDVDRMRNAGLALGGSLDNAIVISGNQVLNQGGLRYEDEFVRHKILDCVGDLYLAGAPIIGHVRGTRSGHALNHKLLRALFEQDDAWCYTSLAEHGVHPGTLPEVAAPISTNDSEPGIALV